MVIINMVISKVFKGKKWQEILLSNTNKQKNFVHLCTAQVVNSMVSHFECGKVTSKVAR